MSTHISDKETCKKPSLLFKREGTMWRCDCGKIYYVTKKPSSIWDYSYNPNPFKGTSPGKRWAETNWTDKNISDLSDQLRGYQRVVDTNNRDFLRFKTQVTEAFAAESADVVALSERITALEPKKVTRGKSADK